MGWDGMGWDGMGWDGMVIMGCSSLRAPLVLIREELKDRIN